MQASTAVKQQPDELTYLLGHFVLTLLRRCGGDTLRIIDETGLSFTQVKALQVLHLIDDTTVKGLGDELGLSLPAISRAVDGLVRKGYATRTEDTEDRRMKRVRTTAKGRGIVDRLFELRAAELSEFVASLPATDRDRLTKALKPVLNHMTEGRPNA
jgi:DNA-binding MarR family transcriptional regulator